MAYRTVSYVVLPETDMDMPILFSDIRSAYLETCQDYDELGAPSRQYWWENQISVEEQIPEGQKATRIRILGVY